MSDLIPDDPEVDAQYRQLMAADPRAPSEATRRAILAQARQLAADRRPLAPHAAHRPGTRWGRTALLGTLAAAVVAGLIIVPHYLVPGASAPPESVAITQFDPPASLAVAPPPAVRPRRRLPTRREPASTASGAPGRAACCGCGQCRGGRQINSAERSCPGGYGRQVRTRRDEAGVHRGNTAAGQREFPRPHQLCRSPGSRGRRVGAGGRPGRRACGMRRRSVISRSSRRWRATRPTSMPAMHRAARRSCSQPSMARPTRWPPCSLTVQIPASRMRRSDAPAGGAHNTRRGDRGNARALRRAVVRQPSATGIQIPAVASDPQWWGRALKVTERSGALRSRETFPSARG